MVGSMASARWRGFDSSSGECVRGVGGGFDGAASTASNRKGSTRIVIGKTELAYAVDAREAVVPPAPPAVGLDLGVEGRGGVDRRFVELPGVGAF